VIYVNEAQLNQVQYLIEQSLKGHHVLFDVEDVKRAFFSDEFIPSETCFDEEQAYSVEHHIERLLEQPSLAEKRAYLGSLDTTTYELVLKTYFNIIENSLYEKKESFH